MVAEPPRFAQNTSESIMGIGLNFRSCASSTVTAARNRITVILSMNIESIADISMNVMNSGTTLYFTALASVMHSQRKNPALAMPSTIIIIPAIKMMVAQLIPLELSSEAPAVYQKPGVKMFAMFSVDHTASKLLRQIPNTITSVASPQQRVTMWRSILSIIISTNITTNISTAAICAISIWSSLLLSPMNMPKSRSTAPTALIPITAGRDSLSLAAIMNITANTTTARIDEIIIFLLRFGAFSLPPFFRT